MRMAARNRQGGVLKVLFAAMVVTCWPGAGSAGSFAGDVFVIGTDAGPPEFDQLSPSIAFNPDRGEYLVVWHNERTVYPDIQAQRVAAGGGLVGGPFYISGGPGAQRRHPDVVYNPAHQEFFVVWEELPDGGRSNIHAQRVGPTGLLVGSPVVLGSGPELASCVLPAVAYASTSDLYMVVWQRLVEAALSDDIEGQILSGTATTVGGNFLVATGTFTVDHGEPDIAYNRSRNEYLIVWTRTDRNVPVNDVWGRLITRDGVFLSPEFWIGYHTSDDFYATVVGTPTAPGFGGYYPVWATLYSPGDTDIYGRVVGWDGLMEPYNEISTSIFDDNHPCVAYDEALGHFFIAWVRLRDSLLGYTDIVGFPYLPDSPQDSLQWFVNGFSYPERPAIAAGFEGEFLVVWDDVPAGSNRDVYGRVWSFHAIFADGFEHGDTNNWSSAVP